MGTSIKHFDIHNTDMFVHFVFIPVSTLDVIPVILPYNIKNFEFMNSTPTFL